MKFNIFKAVALFGVAAVISSCSGYAYGAQVQVGEATAEAAVSQAVTEELTVSAPVISSLKITLSGVQLRWNELASAADYAVYRKTGKSKWTEIGTVSGTSFTDKKVTSGKKYSYTVKCLDSDGKIISKNGTAKSIKYTKPVITKITNTSSGAKISWSKYKGAAEYRVYVLVGKNKWKKLADVKETSYTHKKLKSGKTYTYKVRCIDKDGDFIGRHNKSGISNTFVYAPEISSVKNSADGAEIKWKKVKGAVSYAVYRKTGNSKWKKLRAVKGTSYTDTSALSGKKYTYSIRCLDISGKTVSAYASSKSIKYVKAPVITAFTNTADGTKITWTKCKGATKYRIYLLDGNKKWKKLADVKTTSYTHKKLKNATVYSYKIKGLDSKGKVITAAKAGASNLFIAPPQISSVTLSEAGNLLEWKAVEGVAGYTVFRKEMGGSFEKIADVKGGTSYTDISAPKNKVYAYTLRCIDSEGKYVSYYSDNIKYYKDGKAANGKVSVGKDTYYFSDGTFLSGLQTVNGKDYYYDSKGNLQKNGIVGSASDGWYYADKNGVINRGYVNGVKHKGKKWIVIEGEAERVKTKSDEVLYRAAKEVAKATKPSMTREEKLKACFDYSKKTYDECRPRMPHYTGDDWHIIYADDMFIDGAGNCFSYAAAFAYMAKAIGYDEVYCCNSGGHGWAEVDGLIYDPEWSKHNTAFTYFGLDYDKVKDPDYKGGISQGLSWMRIKIK